ncbi:hypothetical protein LPJ72_003992 [Coemansia sp. Benny D160-2]|nr:hypothetical protein LPJ72_003992 [Coemansia sp. Benny D160-2]
MKSSIVYGVLVAMYLLCLGSFAQNMVETIQSNMDQAMKPAKEIFSQAMEPARDLISDVVKPAQQVVQSIAENFGNNVASIADQAGNAVESVATNFLNNVNNNQDAMISSQLSVYHSSKAAYGFSVRSTLLAGFASAVAILLANINA